MKDTQAAAVSSWVASEFHTVCPPDYHTQVLFFKKVGLKAYAKENRHTLSNSLKFKV